MYGGKSNEPFVNLFSLFSYTINLSAWSIDCKSAGFLTPMLVTLSANFDAQARIFKEKMYGLAPTTHEEAMEILSDGVKTCIQTCINTVQYIGSAGATQLVGSVIVKF